MFFLIKKAESELEAARSECWVRSGGRGRFGFAFVDQRTEEEERVRRGQAAQSRVERGQVSRARHELTGAPLAPKNADPRSVVTPASTGTDEGDSTAVTEFQPELLFEAAEDFARGQVPSVVCRSLMLATMTALQKRDGGVRGIATGCSFRQVVAKVLARQFSDAVEAACALLQFEWSTRAGTDCVGHAIRVATELNPH